MDYKNIIDNQDKVDELVCDFKALSDSNRVKIILLLLGGEKSVNVISETLNLSQSATSHSLRVLKDAKIVKFNKRGNVCVYRLADEHVKTIIKTSLEHLLCDGAGE